ncbi:MAG: hypothetical protein PHD04_00825 [Candidatus Pacebacteria bacterium]|nr:hypothetical protein [Candidatus Paceibacterota bacterium]
MKKIFISILLVLAFATSGLAVDWTLAVNKVSRAGHYLLWKVVCTSNGSSLAATDLVALMSNNLKQEIQGATEMIMTVSPGTGAVAPDTTIDVTLSNSQGTAIFTHTGYSNVADTTGIQLSEDYNNFFTIYDKFYLTLSDIGTAGDQVTLYFEAWIE